MLKKLNPTSNGVRHQLNLSKNLLSKNNRLIKNDHKGLKSSKGRSSDTGHITVRHKGGGVKKTYSFIDFTNEKKYSMVIAVIYDSFRGAFVSQNFDFLRNSFFKTLATEKVFPGSILSQGEDKELKLGCRTIIKNIPTGSLIHSISEKNSKIKYIRSAGTFGQLVQKDFENCQIRLPSGKILKTSIYSFCTIGIISNSYQNLVYLGKAGRSRLKGKRPSVRGIAMNPVDHPHGGRTNGGRPSVTPWGIPTIGKPTVKKNKLI